MPLHLETPLVESRPLSQAAGRTVYLKLEALQPPGSFKIRGIGAACEAHAGRGATRFLSSSGGNAGMAVAYAGRRLGIPVTVVVPETTSPRARQLIEQDGARVIVHGASWQEANAELQSMLRPTDAFLHPFDDPLLWGGHATMIDEAAAQAPKPDAVVLSVGGGGLLCGVAEGLRRNGWADVPIVAVETDGAASLHASLAVGRRVTLDAITSIATSLGARQVCEAAFRFATTGADFARDGSDGPRSAADRAVVSVVVSDADAVRACRRFLDDHRILVEPACGAALALAYDGAAALAGFAHVLVIVCGGATATAAQLDAWAHVLRPR